MDDVFRCRWRRMRKWAEGMDGQDLSSKNDGMSYANWIAIYTPSVAEASYAQCLIIINTVHSRDDCRLISRSTDDCHIVLWLPPGIYHQPNHTHTHHLLFKRGLLGHSTSWCARRRKVHQLIIAWLCIETKQQTSLPSEHVRAWCVCVECDLGRAFWSISSRKIHQGTGQKM